MSRDDKIAEEAMALWMALHHEPPVVRAEGSQMIHALVSTLPCIPYPGEKPGADGLE